MKPELLYITDVYCLWCYGFSEAVKRVASDYAGRVEMRLVNGGMIPQDMLLRDFFGRFPDPVALHQRVTETSGIAFGEPYLRQIRNFKASKRKLNSFNPARAIVAMGKLGVLDTLKVASEIQQAHYEMGLNLSDVESYRGLPFMASVDFDEFRSLFNDSASLAEAIEQFKWVNAIGIQGFPALLLKRSATDYILLARGFMPFEGVKAALDAALAMVSEFNREPGVACQIDGTGC